MLRNTALCYIRLSLTRDKSDLDSPERQRANILAECERRGWLPEWYEDTEGHKSGTTEKGRTGWLALKERLNSPEVVALVANDLARLHRKGWRVGSLLDYLEERQVGLVLAAPGRNFDFTGPQGRIMAMLIAMMDEWYALDTSQRQKDSVRHRKAQGIIVGGIPFGTVRSKMSGRKGLLERSPLGVWVLPDGNFIEGNKGNVPISGAIFRGYIEAAERILELYAENRFGRRRIAEIVNQEGYRFAGNELFKAETVRGIVSNWIEYGGALVGAKAKKRSAREYQPENVVLNPERAVIDIDLCYRVGQVRADRFREKSQPKPGNVPMKAHVYPLARITFCAHCDTLAKESDDATKRAYLTGADAGRGRPRYRHMDRNQRCSALNRTVKAEVLENEFLRLTKALAVKPDAVPTLTDLFLKAKQQVTERDTRAETLAEIALCRQRIRNAEKLFLMVRLEEKDLHRIIDENERQIARLQAEISADTQIRQVLEMAVTMLAGSEINWENSSNEDRQAFAQSLFSEISFDLDKRQITGFKLKPWAEPFLQVRVEFKMCTAMAPEGSHPLSRILSSHPGLHQYAASTRTDRQDLPHQG